MQVTISMLPHTFPSPPLPPRIVAMLPTLDVSLLYSLLVYYVKERFGFFHCSPECNEKSNLDYLPFSAPLFRINSRSYTDFSISFFNKMRLVCLTTLSKLRRLLTAEWKRDYEWCTGKNVAYFRVKGKVKVKLSLCFNSAPRHESVMEEWRYSSTHSLTLALDGGEWSASRPGRFIPGKEPLVPIR
jgi:hypothetical protein